VNDSEGRIVPTANNEIVFQLSGPGQIIGTGNGNPSSHEADKYFEQVSQVSITNLKAKTVLKQDRYDETGVECRDSAWVPVVNAQGDYNVQPVDSQNVVVIRGEIFLDAAFDRAGISLWPQSLGEVQAVYVNGNLIASNIKRDDPVREYKLENKILCKGKNVYALVVSPLKRRFQYDNLNTNPGILQVSQPPQSWKRRVFNGLAQLIVQSAKEAGEIIVTGSSNGLLQGETRIHTQPVKLRPAVSAK
jgi:beta-galactosidase